MSVLRLLRELQTRGVCLAAEGERLHWKAPAGAVTAELLREMRRLRPQLLAALDPNRNWQERVVAALHGLVRDHREGLLYSFRERAAIIELETGVPRSIAE